MPGDAADTRYPSVAAEAESLAQLLDGGLLRDRAQPTRTRPGPCRDFATRDPLDLRTVLRHADGATGCPGAGSVAALEAVLAVRLGLAGALTFATAQDAVHTALAAMLGPGDDVLVDAGAGSALFAAICATGARPHRFPSAASEGIRRRLHRLARQLPSGRLAIALPALSAQQARMADLAALGQLARQHGAMLIIDLSQDFGLMGAEGGGVMELQSSLGRADLVFGCLKPALGIGGAFVAWRDPGLGLRLRRQRTAAAALPEGRAAVGLTMAAMVFGPEGRRRRHVLHGLSLRLRNQLMAEGLRVLGTAAPFVPVPLPPLTALPRTALLESTGVRVGLLNAPEVTLHAPRWRIELSARHGPADIDDLAQVIRDVTRSFDRVPARRPGHASGLTEAVT